MPAYVIISGSHQKNSQSRKVGEYLKKQLIEKKASVELLDLGEGRLPMWNETVWSEPEKWDASWGHIRKLLQKAEGFIFISPEYGGMATPQLKNFFLFTSQKELGHKPGLLVSVSASRSGSYPISELRASSYKNNRVVYLPEQLVIREAGDQLNEGEAKSESDLYLRSRITFALSMLEAYATSLKAMREAHLFLLENDFPNGM